MTDPKQRPLTKEEEAAVLAALRAGTELLYTPKRRAD
jgi:hypothetical protein